MALAGSLLFGSTNLLCAAMVTPYFAQMASLKALVAERTGDAGWLRLRPPLVALTETERAALLAERTLVS